MPKTDKKSRALKFIRKTLISILTLLSIFVIAGVAYTWYMGQNVDTSAIDVPIENNSEPILKRVEPGENVPQGVSIQSITSPALPGSNASITVRTNLHSKCNITVTYNEIASKDSGLIEKPADEYGMVTWAWAIGQSVPLGKWPVKVTCYRNEKSAVVVGNLVVVDQLEL